MSPGSLLFQDAGRWLRNRQEYDAYHAEWEQFYNANKETVPLLLGSVGELRKMMFNAKMRGQGKAKPVQHGLTVKDHLINYSDGGNEVQISLRTYIPNTNRKDLPGMLYFHGGGWALGDLDGEDRTCRVLCSKLALVIVSVDYRLAPENPYPAPLNDAWAALEWVVKHSLDLQLDSNKMLIGGTSAGANIAAVICRTARHRAVPIRGQLLRIPVLCSSETHYSELGLRSMLEMQDTAIITPRCMKQFLQWYNPGDASHITVSPLLAHSFDDLPPTSFQICGRDPLRDEGLAYADALENAGVPVRMKVYPGLPHAFWIFPEISTTQVAEKDLLEGVQWLIDQL